MTRKRISTIPVSRIAAIPPSRANRFSFPSNRCSVLAANIRVARATWLCMVLRKQIRPSRWLRFLYLPPRSPRQRQSQCHYQPMSRRCRWRNPLPGVIGRWPSSWEECWWASSFAWALLQAISACGRLSVHYLVRPRRLWLSSSRLLPAPRRRQPLHLSRRKSHRPLHP